MNHSLLAVAAIICLGTSDAFAAAALARMTATLPGSPIAGTVTLTETKKGLKITAVLSGVPPGEHGLHIHEFGSCEEGGRQAASHYNPNNRPHGLWVKDGPKKAHPGDLGNISADKGGHALLEVVLPDVTLGLGKFFVAGRAVILHEKPDDFGQPSGNAGGRLACGVIGMSSR